MRPWSPHRAHMMLSAKVSMACPSTIVHAAMMRRHGRRLVAIFSRLDERKLAGWYSCHTWHIGGMRCHCNQNVGWPRAREASQQTAGFASKMLRGAQKRLCAHSELRYCESCSWHGQGWRYSSPQSGFLAREWAGSCRHPIDLHLNACVVSSGRAGRYFVQMKSCFQEAER